MEPHGSGLIISYVHSIIEESADSNAPLDVNIKEEYDLDETIDVELTHEDLPIIEKLEPMESDDTLSASETQSENEYSDITLNDCGLPSLKMFKSLLEYVEDEIEPIQKATKFIQLFSVLTKLHTNQEGVYLDKYHFPSTFVQIIELLYNKLKVLCKISTPRNRLPEFFLSHFSHDERLVIVGGISLDAPNKKNVLKYLIGYSVFGEVFFVSNSFVGSTRIHELIQYSGILEELEPEHKILYLKHNACYVLPVKDMKDDIIGSKLNASTMKVYIECVGNKLKRHFQILSQPVLDSMLYSKGDICFLDKLIFVCCMLLNMLPRSTY